MEQSPLYNRSTIIHPGAGEPAARSVWRSVRAILAALAALVMLILVAMPSTRWIVATQLRSVVIPSQSGEWILAQESANDHMGSFSPEQAAQRDAVAQRHPDDFQIQLANATTVEQLRALVTRFPGKPSLYAAILRASLNSGINLNRPEADQLVAQTNVSVISEPSSTPTPIKLEAFNNDAVSGGMLDPDNAYFPIMRAAGLFEAHQDEAATDCLIRASHKPTWEDYGPDEADGERKIAQEALGNPTAALRSLLMPVDDSVSFKTFRALARVAVYRAGDLERSGHPTEGAALRVAVMRWGSLMRAQSHTPVGALTGMAIEDIAISRPNGIPFPLLNPRTLPPQRQQIHREACYRSMLKAGRTAEVRWMQQEYAAVDRAHSMLSQITPYQNSQLMNLMWSAGLWLAGRWLLTNIVWLLLFGMMAIWLARSGRLSGFLPALAILGPVVAGGAILLHSVFIENPRSTDVSGVIACLLEWAFLVAAPLVLFLVSGIIARVRRRPYASQLVTTLRMGCIPAASIITLIYAGLVLTTMGTEAKVNQTVDATTQNEAAYYAAQMGEMWPGPAAPFEAGSKGIRVAPHI